MQTFLPYPDFKESLQVLDYKRLGKQRVETHQVLNVLLKRVQPKMKKDGTFYYGWENHVVTRMWRGHEEALKLYLNISIEEWIGRGYNNTMQFEEVDESKLILPDWFGREDIHRSHRFKLAWKDWAWYCDKFDDVIEQPIAEPEYVWPL
jgi:hypothetical protein